MASRKINRYGDVHRGGQPFRITARLASPIILHDYLCLDSLLAYAVVREELGSSFWQLNRESISDIPVPLRRCRIKKKSKQYWTVWHGSAVQTEAQSAYGIHRLRRRWEDAPQYEKYARYKGRGKINQSAGPLKAWDVPLPTLMLPEVHWYGLGDLKESLRLLRAFIPALGKKRVEGHGFVISWSGIPTNVDRSLFGEDGRCMRPIPVTEKNAAKWSSVEHVAYRAPYYAYRQIRLCISVGALPDPEMAERITAGKL